MPRPWQWQRFQQADLEDPVEYDRKADPVSGAVTYSRRPFWEVMRDRASRGDRHAITAVEIHADYLAKQGRYV